VYKDTTGASNKGTSRYNSISGTTITLGDEVIFHDATTAYTSVCSYDGSKIVTCYEDDTDLDKGKAIVGAGGMPVFSLSAVATGISSGEHTVKTTADGTNLKIYIDGVEKDSVALSGASATDNSNNWVIGQNNIISYMEYMTIDISSVEKLKYQPDSIISDTTLPDETGSNDGTITWGSNPAGVAITVGSIVSSGAPAPSVTGEELPTQDVVPPITQPSGFMSTPISTNTTHVLYPLMHTLSDLSGIPIGLTWLLVLALPITILVLIATLKYLHNQFLVLAFVGVTMLVFWQMGIYPFWIPLIFGFVAAGIVIYERKAAL